MATNTTPLRRAVKRVLAPLLPEAGYSFVHSLSMARDIKNGTLTEPELALLPFAVRGGETVADVGANFGLYTYHLSRAVGPSGKVFAFEPIPYTSATLRRVVRRLGVKNAEVIAKGCSDRPATVTFSLPVMDIGTVSAGQAHIVGRDNDREGKEAHVGWSRAREVACEVVALDDVLPEVAELSLIKCDIEGAELLAFRGAARTIDRHRPTVICEINPWFLEGFGIRLDELLGFFAGRGYELYRYDDRARALRRVVDPAEVNEDNYVFIHPDRLERFRPLLQPSGAGAGAPAGAAG